MSPVLNRNSSENSSLCELIEYPESVRSSVEHVLQPVVPVLPQTVLFLDLLLQEHCIDLAAVSLLILEDVGATVQILRLAGREFGEIDCPTRIQDCIASLGAGACLDAISMRTVPYDHRYQRVAECWDHSRKIAQFCSHLAEERQDIRPEAAYLVGLLHEMGSFPSVLGWGQYDQQSGDTFLAASGLAKKWCFPAFISDSLESISAVKRPSRWSNLLESAHEFARQGRFHEAPMLM